MYPQSYPYMAPPPLTEAQRNALIVAEIRRLRSDLTTGLNIYSMQKIVDGTLQVIEYMLAGAVVHANPNQVPGRPVDPLDAGHTKVEFYGGPQAPVPQAAPGYGAAPPNFPVAPPAYAPVGYVPAAYAPGYAPPSFGTPPMAPPAPSAPVQNGDVQFTRTEPAPQGVEFFAGPAGSPHASPAGYEKNGQRVEFFPNPPGTPVTGAPLAPQAPPVSTQNNPPSSQILPGAPPVTVEAGHVIPSAQAYAPAAGLPMAPPFASVMPPGYPAPNGQQVHPNGQQVAPRQPQTREELLAMLPVPTA